ncbi:MAG: protein kinase [Thermoanaerobaculia bacterium]
MSKPALGIDEIDRKYEILEKLGEGGMGAIYKVRHRFLEELRVIKMIRSELKENSDLQARFMREAKVATQLRHPNIARLDDFSITEDGTAYIVMEFIEGRNLAEVLQSEGPLSVAASLAVTAQCLRALAYLHDRQIVHRDISPDNIMLIPEREEKAYVKLIDLGIAKSLESSQGLTQTGLFVGKVRYGSPEQFSGSTQRKLEARSDLYSMGVVLYEMLTGRLAVTGTDEASVMAGHLFHPPRSFQETDPHDKVPPEVRKVVLKALEKSIDDRYSSADEFRDAVIGVGAPVSEAGGEEDDEPTTVILDRPLAVPASPEAGSPESTQLGGVPESPGLGASTIALLRRRPGLFAGLAGIAILGSLVFGPPRILDRLSEVGSGGPGRGNPPAGRPGGNGARGSRPGPPVALADLDFGVYHALVIGNNRYEQLPRLETAALDAQDIATVLERDYGFKVRLMTDANRYEMITGLTEIAAELTARDNLLVYYAGHGWLDEQNQSGYWQPVDAEPTNTANWISTKYEISAVLGQLPSKRVLVIADSCYSGALSEELAPDLEPLPPGPEHVEQVRQLLERRARLALTSGGLSPVLDVGDGRHSVFSKVLLELLEDNERVVEASRIFGLLQSRVSESAARLGVEQDPRLAPIPQAGDEGGDFFFVPTRRRG